ncbi:MAG: hypothetical protein ACXW2Y_01435 [Acidimicrobiia bacterium]
MDPATSPDELADDLTDDLADDLADAELVARVGRTIAHPKIAPADSFVLHAPLELLARAGLLRHVRPDARADARRRIVQLGAEYAAAGESVLDQPVAAFDSPEDAAKTLTGAIADGDLAAVDRAAATLGVMADPIEIRRLLAEPVAASLAAAGHASILLYLLPRVAPGGEVTGTLLRGPARELARHADWQLHWFDDVEGAVAGGSLAAALLEVPPLGLPGSDFIFPIMHQAEESGIATTLLSGILADDPDIRVARVQLARVAAWSMLQEPVDHAPYGWSHCLTMPQAVMGIAGHGHAGRTALAVAATYVVGFRAALGQAAITPTFEPEPTAHRRLTDAIEAGRDDAASWVAHAPDAALAEIRAELASRASRHDDAHLVKYTLASFDAAAVDREQERLYLAAAASLSAYWAALPSEELVAAG